jgi:Uma2 family endonuclease
MASEPKQRLTIEEYLAFERQSETRNDYLDGEIVAMTGASRRHNRITLNVAFELEAQLGDRDCEVFANEMRLLTPTHLFTYPDIVVACEPIQFDDSELDTLLNPVLVVEVLSKSTEAYDRVTKLSHYRTIPSLAEVILVAQNKVHVEQLIRQIGTEWLFRESDQLDTSLELPSLGCTLDLLRVYRKVFK